MKDSDDSPFIITEKNESLTGLEPASQPFISAIFICMIDCQHPHDVRDSSRFLSNVPVFPNQTTLRGCWLLFCKYSLFFALRISFVSTSTAVITFTWDLIETFGIQSNSFLYSGRNKKYCNIFISPYLPSTPPLRHLLSYYH